MLTDLDELVLEVDDLASRAYIEEAIAAYRARAYRSATVSTWVALSFDILSKVRVLASQGEKAAEKIISDLDAAIVAKNLPKLQQIENGLLGVAQATFEFIGSREAEDLERLLKDRNKCAHPAFTGESVLFTPSGEQVRAHIVHAIVHLLRNPPVQGKAALARIKADLLQPSFPLDQARAREFLATKYLGRARPALIEALVCVLLKVVLKDSDLDLAKHKDRVLIALKVVADEVPETYRERLAEELPRLTEDLADDLLSNVFVLLGSAPSCWLHLPLPVRLRLDVMARHYDFDAQPSTHAINGVALAELQPALLTAFRRADPDRQAAVIAENPRPELAKDAIRLYAGAAGWREAEVLADQVILPMCPHFSANDVRRVLNKVQANSEIFDAGGTPERLERLLHQTARHHGDEGTVVAWRTLLEFAEAPAQRRTAIGQKASRLRVLLEEHGLIPAEADEDEEDDADD